MSQKSDKSKSVYITAREFSERSDMPRATVNLWCRNGVISDAYQEETPFGMVWMIAESLVGSIEKPQRGRPKKEAVPATVVEKPGAKKAPKKASK